MHQLDDEDQNKSTGTDLTDYILDCKKRLSGLLETLGWNEEYVLKSFNTNSLSAKANSLKDENNEVQNRAETEPSFPPSCSTANTVIITQDELKQLINTSNAEIPTKFSELQVNFNREQKLAIYEHVTKLTGKLTEPEKALVGSGEQTLAEIVIQKKQERKKKRKYRTSKPTYMEEMRAVVDLQMQALQQFYGNNARSTKHYSAYKNAQHGKESIHRKESNYKRHRSRSNSREYRHRSPHRISKQTLYQASIREGRKRSCSRSRYNNRGLSRVERRRSRSHSRTRNSKSKRRDKSPDKTDRKKHKRHTSHSSSVSRKQKKKKSRSRSRGSSRSPKLRTHSHKHKTRSKSREKSSRYRYRKYEFE